MKVNETAQIKALSPAKSPEPGRVGPAEHGRDDRVSTVESSKIEAAIAQASRTVSAGRSAKLQAIESAVRQGTYRPDPQRIAQEILDDAVLAARMQAMFMK